jgi:hypothetical protein
MRQGEAESDSGYMKRFEMNVETLITAGGRHILCSPELMDKEEDEPTEDEIDVEENKFKAICFIKRSDPNRYKSLLNDLKHAAYVGRDEYPNTPAGAFELMVRRSGAFTTHLGGGNGNRSGNSRNRGGYQGSRGSGGRGFNFAQDGRGRGGDNQQPPAGTVLVPGRDGTCIKVQCWNCGKWGHTAPNCTEERRQRQGSQYMQVGYGFGQNDSHIPLSWVLLDTCSTASVFCNYKLVEDLIVCSEEEELVIQTNGGEKCFDLKSKMKLFPIDVHFNDDSMANILSLKDVAELEGVRITMDTSEERAISVHFQGSIYKFSEHQEGLYYMDMDELKSKDEISPYCFLESVQDNKSYFSDAEIKGADNARILQQEMGWPSNTAFKNIIKNNLITNTEVTIDDVNRAELIYGTATPLLQGKMVRVKPAINKIEKIPLPSPISKHHHNVNLCVDFFYVNGQIFLSSKSTKLNFVTAQYVERRTKTNIIKTLNSIKQTYEARGFNVTGIHADNEFNVQSIIESQQPTLMHIYGKDEHVGVIERSNRTVKEKCRTMTHALPYKKVPKLMIISLVNVAVKWINAFPPTNGISKSMSPAMIVQGLPKPNLKYKRIVYGSYALVYVGTKSDQSARSVPAIALNPSNEHGGHYFMSLYSGKRLHSYEWKELPIDDDVINRVEELASREDAPTMINGYPVFTWAKRNLEHLNIDHEDDDENEELNDDEDSIIILEDNDEQLNMNEEAMIDEVDNDINYVTEEESDHDDQEATMEQGEDIDDTNMNEEAETTGIEDDAIMNEEHTEEVRENAPTESNNANNRPRRQNAGAGVERLEMSHGTKEYASISNKQFLTVKGKIIGARERGAKESFMSLAADVLFAQVGEFSQMTAKAGIKKFGDKAVAAMLQEFKQLNEGAVPGKPVFGTVNPSTLSWEEKKRALEAVNLIKKKRCGKIKGRTCANGSKQKKYLKHGETISSPTVSNEALLGTLAIDALEERDVAIFDVPGAYLQAEMPKEKNMLMKFRDEFVDIMCDVNEEYRQYVVEENGKRVLYVRVLRAIYGCIESALLWYELFSKTLRGLGFEINPYDKCTANKIINGHQCTICWYVDDNKLSHKDPEVVTMILNEIKKHFGELVISRGNKHDLLGMHVEMNRSNKTVEIEMKDQLQEAIDMFGEDVDKTVVTPALKNLFDVNENATQLDDDKSDKFHSVVAKLLFIMKRARPDLETAVSFLMTRVSKSDEDDWRKLKRCLGFIKGTMNDKRVIGADNINELFVWVDASHAIHGDMRGHTGGVMSLGTGILHGKSSKQKLNTRSTTESELVGVSEYLPYDMWQVNFYKHQGYNIMKNTVFQDNQSAIKMEINGRNSCTGNSRHIEIKYFWVKDQVDKKKVEIQYCPTHLMLADYFTKPLQGKLFRSFREVIMGYKHVNELLLDPTFPLKERVENRDKIVIENVRKNNNTITNPTYAEIVTLNNKKVNFNDKMKIQNESTKNTAAMTMPIN